MGGVESQSGSGYSVWGGGKILGRPLSLLGQAQLWNHPFSDPLQGREDWRRTGGPGEFWWMDGYEDGCAGERRPVRL